MLILRWANKCRGAMFFLHLIFVTIFVVLSAYFFQEVNPKVYKFSPRDVKNVNMSYWKKKLYAKTIGKIKISKKIDIPLPRIPKTKPKRIIKKVDTKKHNPCTSIKDVCLNGGTCKQDGNEWFCNCPQTYYGKSCEFVAEQEQCSGNLCKNNSTCYSVKIPRSVTNPDVTGIKKCMKGMMKGYHQQCNYTLNLMYKCWCQFGFEGDFCEFSEGMRCCAEDHCNNHGIIEYNNPSKYVTIGDGSQKQINCTNVTCSCECEQYYRKEDNCLTISPCRDFECYNGGKCDDSTGEPKCKCPDPADFKIQNIIDSIYGDHCELIKIPDNTEMKDKDCIPCIDGNNFDKYIKCLKQNGIVDMEKNFADECVNVFGKHQKCKDVLGNGFCLNCANDENESKCCQISVANLDNIQMNSVTNGKLILVPKCECKPNYEGDFCENYSLDECDLEDLKKHQAYLETTKEQIDKIQKALGNESFFQTLKSVLYGKWNPPKQYNTKEIDKARGFEASLRGKGMKTFCGTNGYCRPYNANEGMSCKCDYGYRGTECEIWDPCKQNPCQDKKGTVCVDIPVLDGDYADDGDEKLTYACI